MTTSLLARASGLDAATTREQIRKAHAEFDKTRCIGWLRATGNRPQITDLILAKGPQPVERRARAYPEEACDVHPVEA